jgi:hypothetical protein
MKAQAFTFKSDELLYSIITPASIRQSMTLCRDYNLLCQYANNIRALWDTGAESSCISQGLATFLILKTVDLFSIQGLTGATESPVYKIDVLLPSGVVIGDLRVTEFLDNGFFEIVLGMDIITLGDFAVSNKDEKTIVSFRIPPSDTPIDFLNQINAGLNK